MTDPTKETPPALSHQHPTHSPLLLVVVRPVGSHCSAIIRCPRKEADDYNLLSVSRSSMRLVQKNDPSSLVEHSQLRHIDEYHDTLHLTREARKRDMRSHPPSSGGLMGVDPRAGDSGKEGTRQGGREGSTTCRISNTGSVRT